jgi:hypothetical protein
MPFDIPATPPGAIESEPQFFEPQLPDAGSDNWHESLRQIFETEGRIWQRRALSSHLAPPRV